MNKFFGKKSGRFSADTEDPQFGSAFYLEAVQLENIDGEFTDWLPTKTIAVNNFTKDRLIPVGKNIKEWVNLKKEISDSYCLIFNSHMKNIIPFKDVVAFKIRYLGEKKGTFHVFHYYYS